jgi:hypothetical protein
MVKLTRPTSPFPQWGSCRKAVDSMGTRSLRGNPTSLVLFGLSVVRTFRGGGADRGEHVVSVIVVDASVGARSGCRCWSVLVRLPSAFTPKPLSARSLALDSLVKVSVRVMPGPPARGGRRRVFSRCQRVRAAPTRLGTLSWSKSAPTVQLGVWRMHRDAVSE